MPASSPRPPPAVVARCGPRAQEGVPAQRTAQRAEARRRGHTSRTLPKATRSQSRPPEPRNVSRLTKRRRATRRRGKRRATRPRRPRKPSRRSRSRRNSQQSRSRQPTGPSDWSLWRGPSSSSRCRERSRPSRWTAAMYPWALLSIQAAAGMPAAASKRKALGTLTAGASSALSSRGPLVLRIFATASACPSAATSPRPARGRCPVAKTRREKVRTPLRPRCRSGCRELGHADRSREPCCPCPVNLALDLANLGCD